MKTKIPREKSVKRKIKNGLVKPSKEISTTPIVSGRNYTASIKVFGKTFTATGSTVKEAIENLDVGKLNKGVSVLTISNDKGSQSKILPSVQTMRLFSPSKLTREIAIKNTSLRFYGV